jgi:hypothetical protein
MMMEASRQKVPTRVGSAVLLLAFLASLPACQTSIVSVSPDLSRYRTYADSTVKVTFNRKIDPATVTPGSFYVTEGFSRAGPRVEGTLTVSGKEIVLSPASPLKFGVKYKLWVSPEIKSVDGYAFDGVFPEVTFGNTEVAARGDMFVVNIPDDFNDREIGNAYSLMGYLPPLLWLDPEQTDPKLPELIPGIHATEGWKFNKGRPDVLVVVIDNGL